MRTFYITFKNRQTLSAKLSWSHYTLLMRLALSRDKMQVKALGEQGQILESPRDLIKYPYVLGLHEQAAYTEKELGAALIDNLQSFLLELGKGFTFVARQKRMTLDA
jgi:predicted nuclease of restriction endonuclease-like (RecB) superfamily